MTKAALIRVLTLGGLGTSTAVAAPSIVAVQKSHESAQLHEQLYQQSMSRLKLKTDNAEKESQRLSSEMDKHKQKREEKRQLYEDEKRKNDGLETKIREMEQSIGNHKEALKEQRDRLNQQLEEQKKSLSQA